MSWRRFNGDKIILTLIDEVENCIVKEKMNGYQLKVCIGTDSQVTRNITEFATVVVFVRDRHGAFMLIKSEKTKYQYTLKERMIEEVAKSVQTAYELCPILDQYNVDLEVHADINTNPQFKSNSALHDAMGYIIGMGFVFKAKPEAFASTYCANKIVH